MDSFRIKVEEIIIEHIDDIFISSKEKEPLKKQIVDSILIEGNIKPNNEIQNVYKIDILKTQKPENIIELNEYVFIGPKKREILISQIVDYILFEGINRTDNAIQKVDKIEILKSPKPKNIIEENENIFIKTKEK